MLKKEELLKLHCHNGIVIKDLLTKETPLDNVYDSNGKMKAEIKPFTIAYEWLNKDYKNLSTKNLVDFNPLL